MSRPALPVDAVLPQVVAAIADRGVAVVTAPPGSGKTTRVPPALLDAVQQGILETDGGGEVWLVQPRRVAARLAAKRIADERGERPGHTVGWRVRFDNRTSAATRLVAMTEGMLLRAIQADPFLEAVSVVVLDELHERSLDLDVALALLTELRRDARPDLVVVAMSATLDSESVAAFLGDATPAPVVVAEGRRYPVAVQHIPRPSDAWVDARVAGGVRRLVDETADQGGHVLAFLPGVGEIRRTQERLAELIADVRGQRVEVLPLHGRLSLAEQAHALAPAAHRKVVLATNIAETSVTLDGVVAVVDGGDVRRSRFDPATGLTRLETVPCSHASAEQRAGRAGRTRAGRCLRTWTADEHRIRPTQDPPEIQRADLSGALLRLLELGAAPEQLAWLDAPPEAALAEAHALLRTLGCTDHRGLTALGQRVAALPVHPRLGRVVVAGQDAGILHAAATAAALVSEPPLFGREGPRGAPDLVTLVEQVADGHVPGARKRALQGVRAVAEQLVRAAGGGRRQRFHEDDLLDAILAGFPERLGVRRGPGSQSFRLASGRGAELRRPEVAPHAEVIVALALTGRSGREAVVDLAAEVPAAWVESRTQWHTEVTFDPDRQRVFAQKVGRVGLLEVGRKPTGQRPDGHAVATALAAAARRDLDRALPWTPDAEQVAHRLRFVAHHRPDAGLPVPDDDLRVGVLDTLCQGRSGFADLRKADLAAALLDTLTWPQKQQLDALAPARLRLPSGSTAKVTYSTPDAPPVLAARFQQVFGWTETPRVAGGRVPVLMHLLAPNMRPAQITADLAGFWAGTWADVRRDLRGRYPKHAWPEDPATARAEDRPRRKR